NIQDMNLIINSSGFIQAFGILSRLNDGIKGSSLNTLSSRKYLQDIVKEDIKKYRDGISTLYNQKINVLSNSAGDIKDRILAISVNSSNLETSARTISEIREQVNNLVGVVNISSTNEILAKVGVPPIRSLELNTSELENHLKEKEQILNSTIDTLIENLKRTPNQEIQSVETLAKLSQIRFIQAQTKEKIEITQKELLDRMVGNTEFARIPRIVSELKTLKSNLSITDRVKESIDTAIRGLREKFKTQNINSFPELSLNGEIVGPMLESLALQGSNLTSEARIDSNKIISSGGISMKEFEDIVTRRSLSSEKYEKFMQERNLID
ncbi:MAG TPA: hypothetical protein PKC87_06595, partial [Candidatus Absconditabacterales bacterium]|nr:hypothetical protein [Candidatus Absconditabacterales bacterium]